MVRHSDRHWCCDCTGIYQFRSETIVDMVSPQYSEGAKKAKDYAAAAVLVMSLAAAAVGIVIIGGKLFL